MRLFRIQSDPVPDEMFLEDPQSENESSTSHNNDAVILSVSIALLIFGAITNIRKAYHIVITRKRSVEIPIGARVSRFEIYALALFTSNIAALLSVTTFSLLQMFPLTTVCRWKIFTQSIFRFATPTFLLLLTTSRNPRDDASKSKAKLGFLFAVLSAWILISSAPYLLYSTPVQNSDTSRFGFVDDPGDDFLKAHSNCTFRPAQSVVSYVIFSYGLIFGYAVPTFIFILKFCVFNMASPVYPNEYKRYVINLTIMWILFWTPHWTVETFRFFLSVMKISDNEFGVIAYLLGLLPCQVGYVCIPLTCPRSVTQRGRRPVGLENQRAHLEEPVVGHQQDDHELEPQQELDVQNSRIYRRWMPWTKKRNLSPLNHPVSTLLNITLSLTFPLIGVCQSPTQHGDVQSLIIRIENQENNEEAETFL